MSPVRSGGRRRRAAPAWTALALTVAGAAPGTAAAQVTPPPRDMGLPEVASPRPDPASHRVSLDNGVVAYVAEDRRAPLVTVSAFVNVGYADGPDGAAEVLARALRTGGPAGMAPEAFHDALRAMAADYRVVLGPELLEVTLDVPAEDGPAAVALLGRLLGEGPAVGAADLAAVRAGVAPGAGPDSGPVYDGSLDAATRLLRTHLLAGTPYAPSPSPAALGSLTAADVDAFRSRYVVSANLTVAVAGDLAADAARRALASAFGALPRGTRHARSPVAAPALPDGRTLHTYPADKLQGWLVLGTALPVVPRPDEAPLEVMNYILGGGHFDTRLFRETRDKRGLTNDDSGFLEPSAHGPGTYTFRTYGRPEAVRLLLHLTLAEITKIREAPVEEEELFVAKGALADGVFAIRYRDGWATARSFAEEHARTGDLAGSADYARRIRAVTRDDVLRVARAYLHPQAMTGVLIGPLDAIRAAPALEGEGALADYARVVPGR